MIALFKTEIFSIGERGKSNPPDLILFQAILPLLLANKAHTHMKHLKILLKQLGWI